jgi:NADH-ubiquinone oxidoreductase chain 3
MTSSTLFFVFIPLLAIILLAINLIFAPHNPYQEKDSAFECGFHSFLGQNRTQFSISFFIFALLFLLFDLEILLVYPYVVSAYANGVYGLVMMLIFFLALTLGFAFELGKNALKIDSRQMVTLDDNSNNTVSYISMFIYIFYLWMLIFLMYIIYSFKSCSLQTLLNRSYNSLEWALNSPPKPHAFVKVTLQSFFKSPFTMYSKGKSINELADDKQGEWEKHDYEWTHSDSEELEKENKWLSDEVDFWLRVRAKATANGHADVEDDKVVLKYLRSTTPSPSEESAKKRLIDEEVRKIEYVERSTANSITQSTETNSSAQDNNSNHPRSNNRVADTGDNTGGDTGGD